ncbi:MAG TPA: NAD(P)H-binding protein [Prolixibacteraceae bacterium]|nr:NAD(P)H-binding protein [Prolixibacteraceae bacterium]HPR60555.1 NAD(P)H-binding protein [Prolixibacteraceae bacterium]
MKKTALLAGATGLVGKHLLKQLLENPAYDQIIVVSRRPIDNKHPKLKVHIYNFDQLEDLTLAPGIDECFCTLGTTQKKSGKNGLKKVDFDYVVKLASLCKKNNIDKFLIVSSQGANQKSMFFYMRTKGQMEQAVKTSGIKTVYIVRPSLISGKRDEFRLTESIGATIYSLFDWMMVGPLKKIKAVSAEKIANCMIHMAKNPQTGNFIIESDQIQKY